MKTAVKHILENLEHLPILGSVATSISQYYYEARHQRQTALEDKRLNPVIRNIIASKSKKKTIPLFTKIEIETLNRCNNTCPFCPVNRLLDKRPLAKMDDSLFNKIIDQLVELKYTGTVSIFSNNEPYIDPHIVQFLKTAKQKLPQAFHCLYTNGSLLTLDKFIESMKYLDQLVIDNYNDEDIFNPAIKPIYEYCQKHPQLLKYVDKPVESGTVSQQKVVFSMRKQHERLSTRGGQAKNRGKIRTLESSCILPFTQLVVRPTGKVSLCCNDALGVMTLGDLNTQTLLEVWRGKPYQAIREKIIAGRQNINLCRYCDTLATD